MKVAGNRKFFAKNAILGKLEMSLRMTSSHQLSTSTKLKRSLATLYQILSMKIKMKIKSLRMTSIHQLSTSTKLMRSLAPLLYPILSLKMKIKVEIKSIRMTSIHQLSTSTKTISFRSLLIVVVSGYMIDGRSLWDLTFPK